MSKTAAELQAEIDDEIMCRYTRRGGSGWADERGQYDPVIYEAANRQAQRRFDAKRAAKVRGRQARLRAAGKI